MKSPKPFKLVSGLIGTVSVISFVIGLAWSISSGFAGFWGGLPFWVISLFVLGLLVFDYWDQCLRNSENGNA